MAEPAGVDAKTVERWITKGRISHRRHREVVSKALAVEDIYLWPSLLTDAKARAAASVAGSTLRFGRALRGLSS